MSGTNSVVWHRADGSVVACTESNRVLEDDWKEVESLLQDFFEDAVLLGVSKSDFKRVLKERIDLLECPYEEQGGKSSSTP